MTCGDWRKYLNRRTLLVGGLNCGKTHATAHLLEQLAAAGFGIKTTVLDLAPETTKGAGGKLVLPEDSGMLYFSGPIIAPRLTATSRLKAMELADRNAALIERLLQQAAEHNRPLLVVNDATIYLHAGRLELLLDVILQASTVIANAYLGDDFAPCPLTTREKELTRKLMQAFHRIVHM